MSDTNLTYDLVKGVADNDELALYKRCFEENGTERDLENLQWLHQQNLVKAHTIYYAKQHAEVAGIYTALPVLFKVNDAVVPALQSIDTLTDIKHRGKGLFPKLAKKLYADAAENKYELVYGFPNDSSGPGFFNKLGWTSFGEVPFLLKPLNYFFFVKKFLNRKKTPSFSSENHIFHAPENVVLNRNTAIKKIANFGADYDQLWKSAGETIKVCVDRSAAYMNWRYVQKPGEHYYKYGLYVNEQLQGVVVFSIKKKHDGLIAYLMELVYEPTNEKAGKQLLKFATKQCKSQQVDVILAWSLPHSYNNNAYKKAGYYNLPEKIRPQKLFFGVRPFNETNTNNILNITNWYISYSDADTG